MTIASTSLAAALWDEYGRIDANRHNLSLICVQLKLVAIHSEQNIINTCLNTGLNRSELIRWCTFGQLSVISVFVIVTIVDRNHI